MTKKIQCCLFLFFSVLYTPIYAATQTVQIATREVPPFAYYDEQGQWHGIAIELWEKIAQDLNLESEYHSASLEKMLSETANGDVVAAVGALSVTPEREKRFDFSHPFYTTGLGIAVAAQSGGTSWTGILRSFISPAFLGAVGGLLALLSAIGAVVWIFERKRNPQFPKDPARGIAAGLWWSSVTMTTVGYGDKAPITFAGRILGLVWMFASIILISTITASITAALTLDALDSDVQVEDDLYHVKKGTVMGSTSERRLKRKGMNYQVFDNVTDALDALAAGRLEAVIYDKPLLRYLAKTRYNQKINILPITFEPQNYALGLPAGSVYREAINRRLLHYTRNDEWEKLILRHLGE